MQEKAVFIEKTAEDDTRQIKAAHMPKHPFTRAMGSISLICFILISKYADGLPLYRQKIFYPVTGATSLVPLLPIGLLPWQNNCNR